MPTNALKTKAERLLETANSAHDDRALGRATNDKYTAG
jgi:hypothetical protein